MYRGEGGRHMHTLYKVCHARQKSGLNATMENVCGSHMVGTPLVMKYSIYYVQTRPNKFMDAFQACHFLCDARHGHVQYWYCRCSFLQANSDTVS